MSAVEGVRIRENRQAKIERQRRELEDKRKQVNEVVTHFNNAAEGIDAIEGAKLIVTNYGFIKGKADYVIGVSYEKNSKFPDEYYIVGESGIQSVDLSRQRPYEARRVDEEMIEGNDYYVRLRYEEPFTYEIFINRLTKQIGEKGSLTEDTAKKIDKIAQESIRTAPKFMR